jgi:hypothetical protein
MNENAKGFAELREQQKKGESVAIIEAKNRIHPDFIKEIAVNKVPVAQLKKGSRKVSFPASFLVFSL